MDSEKDMPKKRKRHTASSVIDPCAVEGEIKYDSFSMQPKSRKQNTSCSNIPTGRQTKGKEKKKYPTSCQVVSNEPVSLSCQVESNEHFGIRGGIDTAISDHYAAYKQVLLQTSSFMPLDGLWKVVCLLDFDNNTNFLKNGCPLLVYRNGLKFGCECDESRQKYIDTVTPLTLVDLDHLYPPCIHVRFVKEVFDDYWSSLQLPPEIYEYDHGYSKKTNTDLLEFDIIEIPFLTDTYGIYCNSFGLVKVSVGNIRCVTCKVTKNCCHVRAVSDYVTSYEKAETSSVVDAIAVKFYGEKRVPVLYKCYSTNRIPYHLNETQRIRICKQAEECFEAENGNLLAEPEDIKNCPSCGVAMPNYSNPLPNESFLVSKYKFLKIQCFMKACHCGYQVFYDGSKDCVLNMGKFLVHYEILRDYMFQLLHSGHKDRIFIKNKKTRDLLSAFIKKGADISSDVFKSLKDTLSCEAKSLVPLFEYFQQIGCTTNCPAEYREFLAALASNSPVCGTFHFKHLSTIRELVGRKICLADDAELAKAIQHHFPILFDLLKEIGKIPPFVSIILEEIIAKAEAPFNNSTTAETSEENLENPLAFFPNLPMKCSRGFYSSDKIKDVNGCNKRGTRHPTLLPGIFTVFCQHGICYGFEIMECCESPNRPFTFLKTRFTNPPELIIYDNACNLHQYCLNRDPAFFANTVFVVDKLHWDNHTACSLGYKSSAYPAYKNINTQLVEQNNSKLKKLKSSLSYMKAENFMETLKFFLWKCNADKRKNLE